MPSKLDIRKVKADLDAFLHDISGGTIKSLGEPVRLTGGFDTDIFKFNVAGNNAAIPSELVLRVFGSNNDTNKVVKESLIHKRANGAGYPVPAVPFDSESSLIHDRNFIIMEYVDGKPYGDFLDDPTVLAQAPIETARLQAKINSTSAAGLISALTERGIDVGKITPKPMLDRVVRVAEGAHIADLTALADWLSTNWPKQPAVPSICHGDFHPNNILVKDGKPVSVIDLGGTVFSHPEFDVAITNLILTIGPPDVPIDQRELMKPILQQFSKSYLDEYRKHLELNTDLISYYTVLRSVHGFSRVVASRINLAKELQARENYPWGHPIFFERLREVVLENVEIDLADIDATLA